MRNHPLVTQRMAIESPTECAISTITAYELLTGVEKCAQPAKESAKVANLLSTLIQLPFDFAAAEQAARTRAMLERNGQPIGPYDTLLAGQAISAGLILVTNNVAEFRRVAGLVVENWQAPAVTP